MLETEYRKKDYDVLIRDLQKYGGSSLRDNRFKRQPEPVTELDGSYSEEFLRLYYSPSDERFNIETEMNIGITKEYADHHKMVIAYQKEPEEYRRQIEKYIKKLAIDQPPPEQSIAVRRGPGRPIGSKNRPRDLSVNIPPKPKTLGDAILVSMMENMGAATKPKGAAKGPKSPLLKRIKDLE